MDFHLFYFFFLRFHLFYLFWRAFHLFLRKTLIFMLALDRPNPLLANSYQWNPWLPLTFSMAWTWQWAEGLKLQPLINYWNFIFLLAPLGLQNFLFSCTSFALHTLEQILLELILYYCIKCCSLVTPPPLKKSHPLYRHCPPLGTQNLTPSLQDFFLAQLLSG